MFESTKWKYLGESKSNSLTTIVESESGDEKIEIIKRYDFNSSLQRMSVIINSKKSYFAFTKGSPEKLKQLCLSDSVPPDFDKVLSHYTAQGLRVIIITYFKFLFF